MGEDANGPPYGPSPSKRSGFDYGGCLYVIVVFGLVGIGAWIGYAIGPGGWGALLGGIIGFYVGFLLADRLRLW